MIFSLLPFAGLALAQAQTGYVNYSQEAQPNLTPQTVETITIKYPDCSSGPLANTVVCNASADYRERAWALVSMMTFDELVNNTQNTAPGVPRLGLPPYQWWNEALHGLDRANFSAEVSEEFGWATSFPQPILTAAALNRSLIHTIGDIISTQARAFSNNGKYGLDAYSPNINGFRSPLWGRGQETPGEDANFLSSVYAYEYITGLQGPDAPNQIKIAATAKHFAGYDLENWDGHSRLGNDLFISQQDLAEYYTPQFLTAIRDAKSVSLMCSYNAVNGVPSCASPYFLQTILRESWGFDRYDGYVSSDCDAVYNVFNPHNYSSTDALAAADSMRAGTDLDCGQEYPWHLTEAFANGDITRSEVELAVYRLYATLVRLGYFDTNHPYRKLGWKDVVDTNNLNVTYEAAVQGITLLKNDGTLPLKEGKSVALIGPYANATEQMQGNYFGPAPYVITPLQAAKSMGLKATYAFGTNISSTSKEFFDDALKVAKESDEIIFFGGIDNTIEAEGMDRMNLTWPGNQLELISELSKCGKPLTVVQFGGGQVDSSSLKNNHNVNSLVWAGYPGQSAGAAIMDILTGKRAPAGRLVTTQYPAEYAKQLPATDMSLRPNKSTNNPGQTYMWYTGKPVYEFGHGLFYTTFKTDLTSEAKNTFNLTKVLTAAHPGYDSPDLQTLLNVTVTVTNTGDVASDYTNMLFANTKNAGPAPYPNKWLVGFDRLSSIQPGSSKTLTIPVPVGALSRVDEDGNRVLYPGDYELHLGTDKEDKVKASVKLTGKAVTLTHWPADNF
uniref:xylan 1,4-beta-xylosidase n=1 Tax=Blastobotrys adeninivorans TaxID=409370 RepID=A0A060TEA0_BLAAD|nr:beta-xylosidase B [Blastobotrys adeninivorans]